MSGESLEEVVENFRVAPSVGAAEKVVNHIDSSCNDIKGLLDGISTQDPIYPNIASIISDSIQEDTFETGGAGPIVSCTTKKIKTP